MNLKGPAANDMHIVALRRKLAKQGRLLDIVFGVLVTIGSAVIIWGVTTL